MIRYIKNYEATKRKQHPVIMSGGWGMKNADLFAGPADAVAPGNERPKELYASDPPAATGAKVVFIDSDHNSSDRTDPQFAWKSFLRGHNPIVMDWWNGNRWNPIRRAMGQTRAFTSEVNLAAKQWASNAQGGGGLVKHPESPFRGRQRGIQVVRETMTRGASQGFARRSQRDGYPELSGRIRNRPSSSLPACPACHREPRNGEPARLRRIPCP